MADGYAAWRMKLSPRPTGKVNDPRPATLRPASADQPARRLAVVSGLMSDAHTWNLVFLQLLLEEWGFEVINLGSCVPPELLAAECRTHRPVLVVLSSVNGHGYQDGLRAIEELRGRPELSDTPVVLGGKLGTSEEFGAKQMATLLAAGYDAVYDDNVHDRARFASLVSTMAAVEA